MSRPENPRRVLSCATTVVDLLTLDDVLEAEACRRVQASMEVGVREPAEVLHEAIDAYVGAAFGSDNEGRRPTGRRATGRRPDELVDPGRYSSRIVRLHFADDVRLAKMPGPDRRGGP